MQKLISKSDSGLAFHRYYGLHMPEISCVSFFAACSEALNDSEAKSSFHQLDNTLVYLMLETVSMNGYVKRSLRRKLHHVILHFGNPCSFFSSFSNMVNDDLTPLLNIGMMFKMHGDQND
jgi:hypothetical protein